MGLHSPVHIRAIDIVCVPNTTRIEHRVVMGSEYGDLRVYHPEQQRRPILNYTLKMDGPYPRTASIRALCVVNTQYVLIGDNLGRVILFDMNTGTMVRTVIQAMGSVTCLYAVDHDVIAGSLDKYVYIARWDKKACVERVYVKQRVVACVATPTVIPVHDSDEEEEQGWMSGTDDDTDE